MIALDREIPFMGNAQTDFESRQLSIQKVRANKKAGLLKGGKKLSIGKRFSELKVRYNSDHWSNISIP